MKKDCQLYRAQELFDKLFAYDPKNGRITDVHIDKEGYLCWKVDGKERAYDPLECCERLYMPFYEVVMVDEGGDDAYAILMYE